MTDFETWKDFYLSGFCTKDDLNMLLQYGDLTQEQVDEIIKSKPDLTGRVVEPIPKSESSQDDTASSTQQATVQS